MSPEPSPRIFISYSREDGAEFAADLRERLTENDLSIWQDIVALEGGRDWWSQIEDALKSKGLQHFILVVTSAALASSVVRREIRLARQEGKTVCPVRGPGLDDLSNPLRWLGQIDDLDIPERWSNLLSILKGPSRQKRVAMMAPEPPAGFVKRPVEFERLKQLLRDAKGDSVAITAALRGAGGYGKTTLARALAHDPDIQDAYFDGILWAELGEKPENLLSIVSDLVARLTGEPPGLATVNAVASALAEALGDRRILLIVDDAWREADLRPFLQGGPNATRLITTRIDSVPPADAIRQRVDAMQPGEARQTLAGGLPPGQAAAERNALARLAGRLGEWPLLLKLVNGFLRDRVNNAHQPLREAITGVNQRLDAKGLVAFDSRNSAERAKAVARTIGVSLELLDEGGRARFAELAVFPEDADVPIGVVARLWAETAGLADFETEDLLADFYRFSLLLDFDLNRRSFRLHDTVRQFLQDTMGKEVLCALRARVSKVLYLRFDPSVEAKQPDEDALVEKILESTARTSQETFEAHRHAIRQEHAKSHGILKGELTVYKDLPEHLRQGLFATPGSYPIIVRFSTAPGDILSDRVPAHYGMAIKTLGVSGPKAEAGDATRNQDFLLVNSPIYFADPAAYLKVQKLIERQLGWPQAILEAEEFLGRGAKSVLGASGATTPTLLEALAAPPNHILGETFHSMAALRFGDYIAKISATPLSESVRSLTGAIANGSDSILRDLIVDFFKTETAEYELRAQLCMDLDRMPVEDASVLWAEKLSPQQPIAKITLPPQDAYSPGRRVYGDDILSFSPWRCLEAHRPLGSIMRLRRKAYAASSRFRHEMNARPQTEPFDIAEVPD